MSIWQIPLLLKHRWKAARLRPFVSAGSMLRLLKDYDIDLINIPTFPGFPGTRTQYSVSSGEPVRFGVTAGAGVDCRLGFIMMKSMFCLELRFLPTAGKGKDCGRDAAALAR